jgi:hypothetical protein
MINSILIHPTYIGNHFCVVEDLDDRTQVLDDRTQVLEFTKDHCKF